MEQVFNEPVISHFFQSIKQNDKFHTLKQLVLLGIHAVSSKIHGNSYLGCGCKCIENNQRVTDHKGNIKCNMHGNKQILNQVNQNYAQNNLVYEIEKINNKIDQLAANFNKNSNNQNPNNIDEQRYGRSVSQYNKSNIQNLNLQSNIINKKQFRHHLDDSEVKGALTNPYAMRDQKKQSKQSLQKNHQLQKQIDQEQLRKNRNTKTPVFTNHIQEQQEQQSQYSNTKQNIRKSDIKFKTTQNQYEQNIKNKKTAVNNLFQDYNNDRNASRRLKSSKSQYNTNNTRKKHKNKTTSEAKSKIKSLIQKDKQKNRTNAFMKKSRQALVANYCQFEYSDEQAFEQQTKQKQRSQRKSASKVCPVHQSQVKYQQQPSSFQEQQSSRQEYSENKTSSFKETYKQTKQRMKQKQIHEKQLQEQQQQEEEESEQQQQQQQSSSGQDSQQQSQSQEQSKIKSKSKYHQSKQYSNSQSRSKSQSQSQSQSQSDAISQSSSFSKFSMSSRRQAGKISNISMKK